MLGVGRRGECYKTKLTLVAAAANDSRGRALELNFMITYCSTILASASRAITNSRAGGMALMLPQIFSREANEVPIGWWN